MEKSPLRYDREGRTELRGDRKLRFVRHIFNQIANNTKLYLAFERLQNARFLTDLAGETFVLNWLTKDKRVAATTSAMRHLSHSVPILAEVSIPTILRVRREDRDSFQSYREAIERISAAVLSRRSALSRREAQNILADLIEPQLVRIRKDIRYERKRQTRRIAGGLAAMCAGVGLGAFAGLPAIVGKAVAGAGALVGGRLLGKTAETASENASNLRQQNDLYFLIRLEQEAG